MAVNLGDIKYIIPQRSQSLTLTKDCKSWRRDEKSGRRSQIADLGTCQVPRLIIDEKGLLRYYNEKDEPCVKCDKTYEYGIPAFTNRQKYPSQTLLTERMFCGVVCLEQYCRENGLPLQFAFSPENIKPIT